MKANLIKLEYTINMGNYSNVKIGGEWNVEDGESVKECMLAARNELKGVIAEFDKVKAQEAAAKEKAIAEKINNQLNQK